MYSSVYSRGSRGILSREVHSLPCDSDLYDIPIHTLLSLGYINTVI